MVGESQGCALAEQAGFHPDEFEALPLPDKAKKAPDESGAFFVLCARGDLNPHAR